MPKLFCSPKLLTPVFSLLIAASSFLWLPAAANADWGEESFSKTSATSTEPAIGLIHCDDGSLAKWHKTGLTFKIVNTDRVDSETISLVRSGVLSWNRVGGPYVLSEVTSGAADITITVRSHELAPTIVGTTDGVCINGAEGIQSATIVMDLHKLKGIGVRNVAAHETGHGLGLGHSSLAADLMEASYDKSVEGKSLMCPSNLDARALSSNTDPYRMQLSAWAAQSVC